MQPAPAAPSVLPPLRQELAIHTGPDDADGAPTWTLHDPADNHFFQLSWPAFEILSRWHLRQPAVLLDAVRRDTTLDLAHEDIDGVLAFLARHSLLAARSAHDTARLAQAAAAGRLTRPMWLLKHYLFFRIPLVRPMRFLQAAAPHVRWLFSARLPWLVAGMALTGLYLVSQQWDSFVHTFSGYSGWPGVIGIGAALSFSKVAHELGHAFTAHRHGCRVPHMGVAFMVMVPMLYTDTNEAWKLPSRRARMQIGAAGMATELALAAGATLLWSFLPDGPLRAGVFLLATSTWLITLAINLSPFMRFDGYFLLSDWLGMPNLHERAFALGRWHLREWLFGWGDAPPETFTPGRRRFLIAFAHATWLYRLALFLGIALLVYHLFFKLLGILLLAVELGWFIGRPVQQELKTWWLQRGRLRWNLSTARSLALLLMMMLVLCIPWPRGVDAPAVLGARQAQWLYAPSPAQVLGVAAQPGQAVQPDDILLTLDSGELRYELGLAQAREQQLRWQLQQQAFNEGLQEKGATLRQQWEAAREQVAGLQALNDQLRLRPGFAGRVVSLNPAVQPGNWVARGERLLQIASPDGVKVEAYVSEADLPKIEAGAAARFIADEPGLPGVDCEVLSVDRIAVSDMEHAALASPYAGPIPASVDADGRVQPRDAHFRVRLDHCRGWPGTARERVGSVVIGRGHFSFAGDWARSLLAIAHREGGL